MSTILNITEPISPITQPENDPVSPATYESERWDSSHDALLNTYQDFCNRNAKGHHESFIKYRKLFLRIGIPSTALTAVMSPGVFPISKDESFVYIVSAAFFIIASLTTVLGTMAEKMNNHKTAYSEFIKLRDKIKFTTAREARYRVHIGEFVTEIRHSYAMLIRMSPILSFHDTSPV